MVAPFPQPVQSQAVTALLARAVDYAGLYPPAALTMTDAVREYASYRSGPHAWALGRFVVGAGQLDTFIAARQAVDADSWPLSVLSSGDVTRDVALIANAAVHRSLLAVEAIEAKAEVPAAVAQLAPLLSLAPELYVEVPVSGALEDAVAAVASLGARAKIRTGGVTPDAFPPARSVARFMRACVDRGIPFKATAGLHHLMRGEYPLTYDAGSAQGTMFGFLNVFVAAALARRGAPAGVIAAALEERDVAAFQTAANGDELAWQRYRLTMSELSTMRTTLLAAFGSCSFREPIAELAAAGLAAAA